MCRVHAGWVYAGAGEHGVELWSLQSLIGRQGFSTQRRWASNRNRAHPLHGLFSNATPRKGVHLSLCLHRSFIVESWGKKYVLTGSHWTSIHPFILFQLGLMV